MSADGLGGLFDVPMSRDHLGLRDALPPAYTEWIGARLLAHVRGTS